MGNIFKNNEAIVHQTDKGELTVFPKNSVWYKIGFDTNMVTFRSRFNDEVLFFENDVTELTIDGKLPENFVTDFNKIAYGGGKPEIEYDILAVYNVTSTTEPTKLSSSTYLTKNVAEMYIDNEQVEIGNAATFNKVGKHTVKYKLINNTSISSNAFYNCSGLTEIVIPNSVTSISNQTFYGCSSLTEIVIPNSVTSIGLYAFSGCSSLTEINIPNSVTNIGIEAFKDCSGLSNITVSELNKVYDSRDNCNAIIKTSTNELVLGCKNTIILDSVTSICNNAFYNCSGLTEIVIPNSVTSIGTAAFYGCSSLTEIVIPESVTYIGGYAFQDCTSLTSINIPNSVTKIGNYTFRNCSSLTEIVIPDSVTSIGDYVFWGCSSLKEITCSATTAPTIGVNTFAFMTSNGTLHYPCGSDYSSWLSTEDNYLGNYNWSSECFSTEIDYTFSATYNVRNINSPATLYSTYKSYFQDNIEKMYINDEEIPISSTYQFPEIGEYEVKYKLKNTSLPDFAFYQIRTVYTIDLKDITEIGLSCFENGFLKGELILGEKIERIGANAFEQTDITDVTIIPEFISCYNSRFKSCSQLTAVTSNEKFIWSSDFEGCGDLIVTSFPNLEEIGQKAFSRCDALTSFTVPSSVKNISHKAFESCTSLTEITFEMPTLAGVELGTDIFYDCTQHITIDYPCSADYEVLLNQIENYTTNCLSDQYDIKAVYQVLTPNEEIVLFNETNFTPYIEKMYVDNVEIDLSTLIKVNESYSIGNRLVFAETGEHTVKYKLVDSCNFVENAAFLNITSLVSVNLAKDFVSIGYNAFEQCVNLHTVKLPNSVEYIYNGAFYSCTSLTSVTFGEYVREIGWNAFERCHSLNFIEFMGTTAPTITSNSFTDVGASGMIIHPCGYNYNAIRAALPTWDCECDLFEITDFDVLSLYEIDEASAGIPTPIAFELTNISQIYINEVPVGVVSAYTFNSAGQYLVKYKLVDSTTIKSVSGGTSFNKTLNTMFCSATGSLVNFTAKSACTKMYGVALMEGVIGIEQYSFAGCSGLTEVIFPSTLTSVGSNAFNGCTSLDSVSTPSIESWCKISFSSANSNPTNYSKKLYIDGELQTSINIPTNIKQYAFQSCSGLTSVTIGDSVTSVGARAFDSCSSLTSIEIPDSVTSIGARAFDNCTSLTSVTLGSGVTSIGEGAFDNCTNLPVINNIIYADTYLVEPIDTTLTTYSIKEGTKFIGSSAFTSCTSLTSIVIPDSVTSIDKYAFDKCSSLTSVTLGSGVTKIGDYAFRNCTSLTSVTIPDSVTSIVQYAFYGCSGLTSVTLGSGVTKIGGYAFNNCTSLTSINIPNSVTIIDGYSFYKCSGLTSATIGSGVTSIGTRAFDSCTSLASITCNATTAPEINSYTFNNVGSNGVLHYPCGSDYSAWMQSGNYYLGLYNWSSECF